MKLFRSICNYVVNKLWKSLNIHEVCYCNRYIKAIRFDRKNNEQLVIQFGKKSDFGLEYIYRLYEYKFFRIGLRY